MNRTPQRREPEAFVSPRALELRYGWSAATRRRAEQDGRLPRRDFFIGGKGVGWRLATLEAAEQLGPRLSADLFGFTRRPA